MMGSGIKYELGSSSLFTEFEFGKKKKSGNLQLSRMQLWGREKVIKKEMELESKRVIQVKVIVGSEVVEKRYRAEERSKSWVMLITRELELVLVLGRQLE